VIVTANLRDFPPDKLAAYDIEPQHPDEFDLGLIDLALHLLVGDYAYVFMILVTIGGIVWTARPLFRKEGWD